MKVKVNINKYTTENIKQKTLDLEISSAFWKMI